MVWLSVNENGDENMSKYKPIREGANGDDPDFFWNLDIFYNETILIVPRGTITRLIGDQLLLTHGRNYLTWEDEPVEYTGVENTPKVQQVVDSIVSEINSNTQQELINDFNTCSNGVFSEIHNDCGLTFKSPL
jgi:hypothetical protein